MRAYSGCCRAERARPDSVDEQCSGNGQRGNAAGTRRAVYASRGDEDSDESVRDGAGRRRRRIAEGRRSEAPRAAEAAEKTPWRRRTERRRVAAGARRRLRRGLPAAERLGAPVPHVAQPGRRPPSAAGRAAQLGRRDLRADGRPCAAAAKALAGAGPRQFATDAQQSRV